MNAKVFGLIVNTLFFVVAWALSKIPTPLDASLTKTEGLLVCILMLQAVNGALWAFKNSE